MNDLFAYSAAGAFARLWLRRIAVGAVVLGVPALLGIGYCAGRLVEEDPPVVAVPLPVPVEAPPPPPEAPELPPESDQRGGAEMADDLMELGVRRHVAEKELADHYNAVVFLTCLERELGRPVDGKVMERHILRRSAEAKDCGEEVRRLAPDEREKIALAWMAEQEAKKP